MTQKYFFTTLAFLAVILCSSVAIAQDCINFTEPLIKEYALKNWDENGDGCINKTEANNVREIPAYAFMSTDDNNIKTFKSLSDLDINNFPRIKYIGEYAFYKSRIQHLQLQQTIQSIDKKAFANTALCVVELPNVESIGESAFQYSSIECPPEVVEKNKNIKQLKDNGYALLSWTFPKLKELGKYSFANMSPQKLNGLAILLSFEFKNFLSTISDYAFDSNKAIANLTWQNNVTYIDKYAFRNSTIMVLAFIHNGCSIPFDQCKHFLGSHAFQNSLLSTILSFRKKGQDYVPDTIDESSYWENLGENPFDNCQHLQEINLMSKLDNYASFGNNLISLKKLYIYSCITSSKTFYGFDSNQVEIHIPDNCRSKVNGNEFSGHYWKSIKYIYND